MKIGSEGAGREEDDEGKGDSDENEGKEEKGDEEESGVDEKIFLRVWRSVFTKE